MNSELYELIDRKQIEGVIFDMDGVLLDSMSIWENAGALYLASKGKKASKQLGKILLEMNMEQGAAYLKKQYKLAESLEQIIEGINQTVCMEYRNTIPLKKGIRELLEKLKQKYIKMTVATSSERSIAVAAFQRLQILGYFEGIFTCSEYKTSKSEPLIFEKANQKMQTYRQNTWVFEDSLLAATTAHKAGFHVVGVFDESSREFQEELRKICDCYIRNE